MKRVVLITTIIGTGIIGSVLIYGQAKYRAQMSDRVHVFERRSLPSEEPILQQSIPFEWKVYRNQDYGFAIRYPDFFVVEGDPSGLYFTINSTNSALQEVTTGKYPLIIEVIVENGTLTARDFAHAVIRTSERSDTFQLFHQSDTVLSGNAGYTITFTGAIEHDPYRDSGAYFDELMEVVFIRHGSYILAIFIPQSNELFTDIVSTLILFDTPGGGR